MLALASLLILSSCGQTAGVKTAGAQQATGEIIASSETAVAQTESGKVGGFLQDGIYIYKGIPYAKAERFMPPQPADKWEGVRSSRMFGPTCPQAVRMGWGADEHAFAFHWDDGYPGEDCLRVNIWTPGLNDGKKRPVMVWLHGGGYAAGSGQELPSYDGFNLAKKGDAVVVTLNHRLNVLGFLDLSAYGDKYAKSGNAGLLDLVAALQWVNKNIAAFGGDAQNVTIFGQSGGGGKVSTLLATPSAKGLYHKAIVQSGSMLRTMDAKYSRRIGAAVMDELGLKASQIDELQKMPYERLLAAGEKAVAKVKAEVEKEDGISTFIFGWAPTVDGDVLPAQPFDPQAPAQSKDVPVMIGTTLHEFTMSTYVPAFRTITKEKAVEFLKQRYGDRTDDFLAAFEFHGIDARLTDQPDGVAHAFLRRDLITAKRHVADHQRPLATSCHAARIDDHLVQGDGEGGVVSQHHVGGRVADQNAVNARLVYQSCRRVVVGREHGYLVAVALHLYECLDGNFFLFCCEISHFY